MDVCDIAKDYLSEEVLPYVKLSQAVYEDTQQVDGFTRFADDNVTNPATSFIDRFKFAKSESESFHGSAYISGNGKIVIAFKGTDNWGDVLTDIRQLKAVPIQYTQALMFVKRVLAMGGVSPENIVVTGHSLGGGMAQYVASAFGLKAVTFNPAPLSAATIKSASELKNGRGVASITNYVATSKGQEDLVASSIGAVVGEVRRIELPEWDVSRNHILGQGISRHSIDTFVNGISDLILLRP
jgi:hypothetical protein